MKKNVAAIHVSGKLRLLQRKLSNVLILNANDTLTSRAAHEIDACTLCMMIGYNSNDMDTPKASLRGLGETVSERDMLDASGRQEWGISSLLSYAKLKEGICECAYSPALAEKLHDPKVFALINLNIQRRFSSGQALALYENCYRFVRRGGTGWWPIELFRRLSDADHDLFCWSIDPPFPAPIGEASAIDTIFAQVGGTDMAAEGSTIPFNLTIEVQVPRLCHHRFPQLVHEPECVSGAFAAPLGPRSPSTRLDIQVARKLDSSEPH